MPSPTDLMTTPYREAPSRGRRLDQPQSEEDREAIVTALRTALNDSALDVRWNPTSYVTRPGQFDAFGKPIKPVYDGRWEVIRHLGDGQTVLVWQVKEEVTEAYRPLGLWLVEFMARWDRANVAWMDEQRRLLEAEESRERMLLEHGAQEDEEFWARKATDDLGMKRWIGRGVDLRAGAIA